MRLIIKDLETDTLLYGHQEIQAIIRGGKRVEVKTLGMPIEVLHRVFAGPPPKCPGGSGIFKGG
jgi:hypothetical protein